MNDILMGILAIIMAFFVIVFALALYIGILIATLTIYMLPAFLFIIVCSFFGVAITAEFCVFVFFIWILFLMVMG